MDDQVLKSALQSTQECPPIEELSSRIHLPTDHPDHIHAQQHIAGCPHCQTELALLRSFESCEILPEEKAAVQAIALRLRTGECAPKNNSLWTRFWKQPRLLISFASAAAVLAIAAGVALIPHPTREPLSDFAADTARAGSLQILPSTGAFRWKPVTSASRYEITVRTLSNTVIFHKFLTETTLLLPPPVASIRKAGKVLRWEIVARNEAGEEVARSGIQTLNPHQ